jgi:hypothetical protein
LVQIQLEAQYTRPHTADIIVNSLEEKMALFNKNAEPEKPVTPAPVGRTQTLSLVAFVVSFFESIIPIVLGHVALRNYKKEEDQTWRGFAVAGLILGYVGLVIRIKITVLIIIALMLSGSMNSGKHGYPHMEKSPYSHGMMSEKHMGKNAPDALKNNLKNMEQKHHCDKMKNPSRSMEKLNQKSDM